MPQPITPTRSRCAISGRVTTGVMVVACLGAAPAGRAEAALVEPPAVDDIDDIDDDGAIVAPPADPVPPAGARDHIDDSTVVVPPSPPTPIDDVETVDDNEAIVAPSPTTIDPTPPVVPTTSPPASPPSSTSPVARPPASSTTPFAVAPSASTSTSAAATPGPSEQKPTDDPATTSTPALEADEAAASTDLSPAGLPGPTHDFLAHTRIFGLTQVDFVQRQISTDELSDGTHQPLNEDKIQLRRARLGFVSDWRWAGASGQLEFFGDDGITRPVSYDVYAQVPGRNAEPPLVQLRAGLFPVPFGFETGDETDSERFFAERAMLSDAFAPGRFDLGVALSGHVWAIDWILALQNGEPIGSTSYPYDDPNRAKDAVGRLRVGGPLAATLRASMGLSGLYGKGFSAGTPPTKDSFEWQDLNEDGRVTLAELIPVPGSAGRPSSNFDRWGAAVDAQVWTDIPRLGELMIYGEAAVGINLDRGIAPADPVLLGRDQRGLAWLVAFRQHVTPYFSFGARHDSYEPNFDALEGYDGVTVVTRRPFHTTTAAVTTQLPLSTWALAKLGFEYAHQRNSLGRDASGRPAQLDNDTLRVRFSVMF